MNVYMVSKSVLWTMLDLFLLFLNTCLAKDATREGETPHLLRRLLKVSKVHQLLQHKIKSKKEKVRMHFQNHPILIITCNHVFKDHLLIFYWNSKVWVVYGPPIVMFSFIRTL
jgi:hypothetical protein